MQDLFGSDLEPDAQSDHGRDAKHIGYTGETLAAFVLQSIGLSVAKADETQPFDLVAFVGAAAIRIQVKSTRRAVDGVFRFNKSRGFHGTKTGVYGYAPGDYHILALAAVNLRKVVFEAASPSISCAIRSEEFLRPNAERDTWNAAVIAAGFTPSALKSDIPQGSEP